MGTNVCVFFMCGMYFGGRRVLDYGYYYVFGACVFVVHFCGFLIFRV